MFGLACSAAASVELASVDVNLIKKREKPHLEHTRPFTQMEEEKQLQNCASDDSNSEFGGARPQAFKKRIRHAYEIFTQQQSEVILMVNFTLCEIRHGEGVIVLYISSCARNFFNKNSSRRIRAAPARVSG